jgi:hypothetical protein
MNRHKWISVAIVLVGVIGISIAAQSFTTLNSPQYWGKTGIPALTSALDTNFSAMSSTSDVTYNTVTVTGTCSANVLSATGTVTGSALTGTTIGGITEANLVDKSATESISGTWTFVHLTATGTVTASGDTIIMANLPTATTGLASGTLWNNSNVINVVP